MMICRGRLEMSVAGAPTAGWSVRVRSRKSHDFRYRKNQAGCGIVASGVPAKPNIPRSKSSYSYVFF